MRGIWSWLLALFVVWGALGVTPLAGQTRTLSGFVRDEAGEVVPGVRIRLVGVGTPSVYQDSGEFVYEVPVEVASVVVEVLAPKGMVVQHPRGGNMVVPAEPVPQMLVIGPPIVQIALNAAIDSQLRIEYLLGAQGDRLDDLRSELVAELRPLIDRLQLRESELDDLIEERRKRNDLLARSSRLVDTYVLRLKDLRDAIARLAPHVATDEATFLGLRGSVVAYNEGFEAVYAARESFAAEIANAWPGERSEVVRTYWSAAMNAIVDRIHGGIVLGLSPRIEKIQMAFNSRRRLAPAEFAELDEYFARAAERLNVEIPSLESFLEDLRRAMERH